MSKATKGASDRQPDKTTKRSVEAALRQLQQLSCFGLEHGCRDPPHVLGTFGPAPFSGPLELIKAAHARLRHALRHASGSNTALPYVGDGARLTSAGDLPVRVPRTPLSDGLRPKRAAVTLQQRRATSTCCSCVANFLRLWFRVRPLTKQPPIMKMQPTTSNLHINLSKLERGKRCFCGALRNSAIHCQQVAHAEAVACTRPHTPGPYCKIVHCVAMIAIQFVAGESRDAFLRAAQLVERRSSETRAVASPKRRQAAGHQNPCSAASTRIGSTVRASSLRCSEPAPNAWSSAVCGIAN